MCGRLFQRRRHHQQPREVELGDLLFPRHVLRARQAMGEGGGRSQEVARAKAGKVTLYVSARKEGGSVSVYSARRKALRRAKRRRRGADRLRHGRRTGLRAAGPAIGARGEHRARGAAARVGWSRPAADADERAWNPGLTCGGCRPCAPTPLDERGLIKRLLAYCPSLASAP